MLYKVIIYLSLWLLFLLMFNKIKNKGIVNCIFMIIVCTEIYFFIHPTMTVAEDLADGLKYVVDTGENQKMIDGIKENEQEDFYTLFSISHAIKIIQNRFCIIICHTLVPKIYSVKIFLFIFLYSINHLLIFSGIYNIFSGPAYGRL